MQTHARVVVVGGGCVGAGILYGLAKRGWTDVALLERTQLTAGSTWHAAGLLVTYARNINFGRMINKTIDIYKGLEKETGQAVGLHMCGQLRLATSSDRMDEYKSYMSMADSHGSTAQLLTPAEIKALWPLHHNDRVIGGLYHPDDGHIAPADVTHAMAKGARDLGAKIYQNTEVTGFRRLPGGEWLVQTPKGDITCEHVVLATGNYARQTGAMLGLEIPAIPILHQYWVTEPVPELIERKRQGLPEMPILRDEDFEGYLREEGNCFMFGPYERTEHLKLFAENGVPKWFGADLVEEDFDAVAMNWERALDLVPSLGGVGLKSNVRGPFQMTPDEMPLVGPAWGLDNVWLAEGVPGGIMWGGAIGYYLSERIVEGGNSIDTSDLDPRRFGTYANKAWTLAKVREAWGTHAEQKYPGQDMPAGRPQKTAPSYDLLSKAGAVWGVLNGWEVPNWFATQGVEAKDQYSWRWTEKGRLVGEEVAAVRNDVGLVEMTPMTKFEVSGPGAEAWLDHLLANRLPQSGRVALAHKLNKTGGVEAEYVVTRLADDVFFLIGTPRAERLYFDELSRALPQDGSVTLRNVSSRYGCFTVVGPKAREVLQPLTETDLSNAAFPAYTAQTGTIGLASDVRMLRVNYEGELGWELYHPIEYQRALLATILEQGRASNLRLIGYHALESLRLDKSYRAMFRDMNPELSAWESGLSRFIRLDKGDFVGRDALMRLKDARTGRVSVTLSIPTDGASTLALETLYRDGAVVGRITSGSYSYTFGTDLALAIVDADAAAVGTELEVMILGQKKIAKIIADSPYDPKAERARA